MKKTTQLKGLLQSDRLEFLMEAHNGLSARIVEEAGFKGIWASGLSISAALGVRDSNEASWTQVLEVVEFMSDATGIPILLDGDTGYGNFNNMRRLVKKLEQRGVAGVCIEDKLFPKTNSFINGEKQPLADMDEFAGKIKAGKDAQSDPDFCIVARVEALIAGWGQDEALKRARAYADAGADAILVHSKKSTADQIVEFMRRWDRDTPIVIVPTKYYATPVEVFERHGVSLVIWANHNVRASIRAMQETTRRIFEERSIRNVEDRVVSVKEVFRLQNAAELADAEAAYLPSRAEFTKGIILAASRGADLAEMTTNRPKAMIDVGGRPLVHRLVDQFRAHGVRDLTLVRGYAKEQVDVPDVKFVDNDDYADTGELVSLDAAREHLDGDAVMSFGDILFRKYILNTLLHEPHDVVAVVDAAWKERARDGRYADYVSASKPYSLQYDEDPVTVTRADPGMPEDEIAGEWIGLLKTTRAGTAAVVSALDRLKKRDDFRKLRFKDLFNELVADGQKVHVLYVTGHWLDVDTVDDLSRAQNF